MFSKITIATFALVGYSHAMEVEYHHHNPYPSYNKLKALTYAFQVTVEDSINCFYENSTYAYESEWCDLFLTRSMDQIRIGLSEIANSYDCYAWDEEKNICEIMGLEPAVEHHDVRKNYIETRKIVKAFNLAVEKSDVCFNQQEITNPDMALWCYYFPYGGDLEIGDVLSYIAGDPLCSLCDYFGLVPLY